MHAGAPVGRGEEPEGAVPRRDFQGCKQHSSLVCWRSQSKQTEGKDAHQAGSLLLHLPRRRSLGNATSGPPSHMQAAGQK